LVQQVRRGLFRLHWIFDQTMLNEGCHKMNFYLDGSMFDQITISYHLNYKYSKSTPYKYRVTVDAAPYYEESLKKKNLTKWTLKA
jgi:hypothetical protein